MDIHETIKNRLVTGVYAQGARLRADVLAKEFRCSASTLREILFRLSTVGLVDFQEQRGFRVPQSDRQRQHELTQLRIILECEGACLSIRQGGVAWEARLSAAHHKLGHIESKVRDGKRDTDLVQLWTAAEFEFHQTLIGACGSDLIMSTHDRIYQQFRQQLITTDKKFVFIPENIEQHRGILEAAMAHDEGLIRARIADHLARNLIAPIPQTEEARATLAEAS